MHPRVSQRKALLTPRGTGLNVSYLAAMRAYLSPAAHPLNGESKIGSNPHAHPPAAPGVSAATPNNSEGTARRRPRQTIRVMTPADTKAKNRVCVLLSRRYRVQVRFREASRASKAALAPLDWEGTWFGS